MKWAALVVAAGRGTRAGQGVPKQYRRLGARPVLRWSLDAFAAAGANRILVAIHPDDRAAFAQAAAGMRGIELVHGGETRTATVRAGLDALAQGEAVDAVLIHDAARPGITGEVMARLLAALSDAEGAGPALPVADALKRADADGWVTEEPSRAKVWRIQTPQAFRFADIRAAYAQLDPMRAFDDDLAVARVFGLRTRLIEGAETLAKITFAGDHDMTARLLGVGPSPRVGVGFDAHRFGKGDHVTLCGVRIPHKKGLVGHSDADAAWHALTDAILGALGEGDIGDHFPPSDPKWAGADSEIFLAHALSLVRARGGALSHVDVTLICENPRVKPHREAMRRRTAEALGLALDAVSVKATTTEQLGFLGREEGLAAQAVATVLI